MTDALQQMLERTGAAGPFSPSSRYNGVPRGELRLPDGRVVPYVLRRPIAVEEGLPEGFDHRVSSSERLDQLAHRYLGDPELAWRICDANPTLRPSELMATPGDAVRIPLSLPGQGVPGG